MFNAQNERYADAVRAAVLAFPVARLLGLEFGAIAPGEAEIILPYRVELSAADSIFQAGVVGAIADIAAGSAAATLLPVGRAVMTCDFTVKLVTPALGECLIARGSVVRPGSALTVSRAEVFARHGEKERLCAVALVTLMNVARAA